jgi:hypothetical protein
MGGSESKTREKFDNDGSRFVERIKATVEDELARKAMVQREVQMAVNMAKTRDTIWIFRLHLGIVCDWGECGTSGGTQDATHRGGSDRSWSPGSRKYGRYGIRKQNGKGNQRSGIHLRP